MKIIGCLVSVLVSVLLIALLIQISELFANTKLESIANAIIIAEDQIREIVNAYANKIVTYAAGFSDNPTAIKSIGIYEFGVPGVQVFLYRCDVNSTLRHTTVRNY